jgi:hypothetical protein
MAIQKLVMTFSRKGISAGSFGASYLGRLSSSSSWDDRGSTLSTRPSVDGRFSAQDISSQFRSRLGNPPGGATNIPIAESGVLVCPIHKRMAERTNV